MAKRSRFWVVRSRDYGCGAANCNFRILRSAAPPRPVAVSFGWPDRLWSREFFPHEFFRLSPIRLKPGAGPVELAWPLFAVKE